MSTDPDADNALLDREADPPAARRGYEQAMDGFDEFLVAAAKNRGMYRELVGPARGHARPRRPLHLAFSPTLHERHQAYPWTPSHGRFEARPLQIALHQQHSYLLRSEAYEWLFLLIMLRPPTPPHPEPIPSPSMD